MQSYYYYLLSNVLVVKFPSLFYPKIEIKMVGINWELINGIKCLGLRIHTQHLTIGLIFLFQFQLIYEGGISTPHKRNSDKYDIKRSLCQEE